MADEWAALRALLPDDGKAVTPEDRVVEERMETIWKEQQKAATVMQKGAGVPEVSEVLRPLASMAPFFGVITHQGRTSGRTYRSHTDQRLSARGRLPLLLDLRVGRPVGEERPRRRLVFARDPGQGGPPRRARADHRSGASTRAGPRALHRRPDRGSHAVPTDASSVRK